ncbi:MAG: apolipoprotein N-acyltransferase [Deltaproteobacteria bacterium]|nr:apolipoprotein N-acyltransferase [Deltaproteobacteria bacterium]
MTIRSLDKLCAILSGLMLTAAFPPSNTPWIAWIALVPLLKAISGKSAGSAFALGLTAGVAHYGSLVYWIVVVLEHYGGLHLLTSLGVLALFCFYLALYPALFALLSRGFQLRPFRVLGLSALWVSVEFIRAKALTGFPWCLLGHTQHAWLDLIQISDVAGVYGISFLLVASNALLYNLIFHPGFLRMALGKLESLVVILLVSGTLFYGVTRFKQVREGGEHRKTLKVAIAQGDIDQSIKWNPRYQERTIRIYEELSLDAATFGPDLTLWPETAVPFFFYDHPELSLRVLKVAENLHSTLIFGGPAYRRQPEGIKFYNRAYMISPQGRMAGHYDKIHLVPFGEYVPLKRFLPFVNRLVPAAGDFAAGEKLAPLATPLLPAGVLICFEVIFPELAAAQVRAGAEILLNLTNDAWFGRTSAPHQHLAMAVFRAVENRRPLFRAANTGISAFISPAGEITGRSGLFTRQLLKQEVPLSETSRSFYTLYGDVFAGILLLLTLIQTVLNIYYKVTRSSRAPRE